MSKQSAAKDFQGYTTAQHVCATCTHYASQKVDYEGVFGGTYINESNKRCSIGGFAVKKMATCNLFEVKQ